MKVINTYEQIRNRWYSWTVLLAGTPEELGFVKHVTYFLHESFPNRKIVSTNPVNNFTRTLQGWGEFLLNAEVTLKNGQVQKAQLWLDLGFEHTLERKNEYDGVFRD